MYQTASPAKAPTAPTAPAERSAMPGSSPPRLPQSPSKELSGREMPLAKSPHVEVSAPSPLPLPTTPFLLPTTPPPLRSPAPQPVARPHSDDTASRAAIPLKSARPIKPIVPDLSSSDDDEEGEPEIAGVTDVTEGGMTLWNKMLKASMGNTAHESPKKAKQKGKGKEREEPDDSVAQHSYAAFTTGHREAISSLVEGFVGQLSQYCDKNNLNPTAVWGYAGGDLPSYSLTPWQGFLKSRALYRSSGEGTALSYLNRITCLTSLC